jgi:hypothetical protein
MARPVGISAEFHVHALDNVLHDCGAAGSLPNVLQLLLPVPACLTEWCAPRDIAKSVSRQPTARNNVGVEPVAVE